MTKANNSLRDYSHRDNKHHQERDVVPDAVREISKISFEGNIVPHSWYQRITFESGKPDLPAITILSELVYWYRPIKELTATGKPYLRKRFYADRFECNAAYFSNKFGFTKTQVRRAIQRLVDLELIDREYRTVIRNGTVHNNMMAIEPIVEKIIEITHHENTLVLIGKNDVLTLTPEGEPLSPEDDTLSLTGDTPSPAGKTLSLASDTPSPTGEDSKITTKTTTKITTTTTKNSEVGNEKNYSNNSNKSGGGSGNQLIFDFALVDWTAARRQRAEKALEGLEPETAQDILDELNESISAGKVKQPLAWLRKVAERARSGEFEPTNEIADRRETEQRRKSDVAQKAEAKPSQIWKDHKDNLKVQFGDDEFNQNIVPLRGLEHGKVLVLEAPNRFVADWVKQNIGPIQDVIGMHTNDISEIKVKVG